MFGRKKWQSQCLHTHELQNAILLASFNETNSEVVDRNHQSSLYITILLGSIYAYKAKIIMLPITSWDTDFGDNGVGLCYRSFAN